MAQEYKKVEIVKIILDHFKPKEIDFKTLDCLSEVKDVKKLADELLKVIHREYLEAYDLGWDDAAKYYNNQCKL